MLQESDVLKLMKESGIVLVKYNPIIEKILNMREEELENISYDTIADYIVLLGQYLIYLDNQYTLHRFMYEDVNTRYKTLLAMETKNIKNGTVAEKEAGALEDNPELAQLKDEVELNSMIKNMFDNKTSVALEYLNAMKHKKEKLQLEYQNQYRSMD